MDTAQPLVVTELTATQRKYQRGCIRVECRVCHNLFQRSKYTKAKDTICRSCHCKGMNKPGAEHPAWKGGVRNWLDGKFNYDHAGFHWKKERLVCLERDQYTCQSCGMKKNNGCKIIPHHIVPYEQSYSHAATNLIALCSGCHWYVHQFLIERPNEPIPFTPQASVYDPEWHSRRPEFVIDLGPAPF